LADNFRILFIGDIIGKLGRRAVREFLPGLKAKENINLVVANGENAAGGVGITEKIYGELLGLGVDVITTGNHVWHQQEMVSRIDACPKMLRPANYPPGTPGQGSLIYQAGAVKIGVLNLEGRVFMKTLDCPFRAADELIKKMSVETNLIIIDFHAEATSEKIALMRYVAGRVTTVLGTHTHVMTADEQIVAGHTGYLTDVGMVGALDSVIGVEIQPIIDRFVQQLPHRFEPVEKGPTVFNAVVIEADPVTGRCLSLKRINEILDGQ
jgi:2',3'-cyclic-nucleotide 2'-phosphodiesterase